MEIRMHSTWITSIGIDAKNQFIVTGPLKEPSIGRLNKIFRPPTGEGSVGIIFAVTFLSDGKTIVSEGSKSEDKASYSIYFFDR
jgi:hypothetical protein